MKVLEQRSQLVLTKLPVSQSRELWISLIIDPASTCLDFRVYWMTDDKIWHPTKQGMRIRAADWPTVQQVLTDAAAYAKLEGITIDESAG